MNTLISPAESPGKKYYDDQVAVVQIRQLFDLTLITVIAPIFGAVMTALMLKDYVPANRIFIWLALVIISFSAYLVLWQQFRQTTLVAADVKKWSGRYLILGWIAAGSWGSVSFFLFSDEVLFVQILLVMTVLLGMAALMAFTLINRPAFYTALCLVVPLFIQLVRVGGDIQLIFAFGSAGFTVMLFILHHYINKAMERSLLLQFKNEQLATDLGKQKEIAEQANLAKSRFLALATHDLRQPLQAHGLFLGELRERLPADTVVSGVIEKLESTLKVMSDLFNSLLDKSKLEAGTVEPKIESFRFRDFIIPIEQEYTAKAAASGLAFRVAPVDAVLRSDKVLLGRILRNLLENALRYTDSGSILVECLQRKDGFLLQVRDTGTGIPEAEQANIFNDYYQIKHHSYQKTRGLGLGLAVVRQLAELLDHKIGVESVIDQGSVFSVLVPVGNRDEVVDDKTNMDTQDLDDLNGLNVIVIDDEQSIQESLDGILSAWGCNVVTGADAEEILKNIPDGFTPDVILSDYQLMSEYTGIEAIERLRNRFGPGINAAVITGDTSQKNDALDDGGFPILYKPVSPAKLRTLLRFLYSNQ